MCVCVFVCLYVYVCMRTRVERTQGIAGGCGQKKTRVFSTYRHDGVEEQLGRVCAVAGDVVDELCVAVDWVALVRNPVHKHSVELGDGLEPVCEG